MTTRELTTAQKKALVRIYRAARVHHAVAFSAPAMRTTIASLQRRGLIAVEGTGAGRYPTLTLEGRRVAAQLAGRS